jgi:plasmid stability protein
LLAGSEVEGFMKVQLATRLDPQLRQRLRIYAAVTGRTVEDVVRAALDGYLPPAMDMVRRANGAPCEDTLVAGQPEVA